MLLWLSSVCRVMKSTLSREYIGHRCVAIYFDSKLSELYIIKITHKYVDCLNVNFYFSTVVSTVFIFNIHPINKLPKAWAALVNTISTIYY